MEAWLEKGWRVDLNSKGRTEREGGRRKEYLRERSRSREEIDNPISRLPLFPPTSSLQILGILRLHSFLSRFFPFPALRFFPFPCKELMNFINGAPPSPLNIISRVDGTFDFEKFHSKPSRRPKIYIQNF